MSEFEILKGVSLPSAMQIAANERRKYPFHKLAVGDMFFVPERTKNTLSTRSSTIGKKLNAKYKTRMLYMRKNDQNQWEHTVATDPDAILGIGVWRTA